MQAAAELVEKILDAVAVVRGLHGDRLHYGQQVLGAVTDLTQQSRNGSIACPRFTDIGDNDIDAVAIEEQAGFIKASPRAQTLLEFQRLLDARVAAARGQLEQGGRKFGGQIGRASCRERV